MKLMSNSIFPICVVHPQTTPPQTKKSWHLLSRVLQALEPLDQVPLREFSAQHLLGEKQRLRFGSVAPSGWDRRRAHADRIADRGSGGKTCPETWCSQLLRMGPRDERCPGPKKWKPTRGFQKVERSIRSFGKRKTSPNRRRSYDSKLESGNTDITAHE